MLDAIEPRLPATWKAAGARLSERRVRLPLEQGLTDDMRVNAAIQLGARNVQLWLLDNIHLSRGALERLQVEGVTRAIRNRAAQRVRLR